MSSQGTEQIDIFADGAARRKDITSPVTRQEGALTVLSYLTLSFGLNLHARYFYSLKLDNTFNSLHTFLFLPRPQLHDKVSFLFVSTLQRVGTVGAFPVLISFYQEKQKAL